MEKHLKMFIMPDPVPVAIYRLLKQAPTARSGTGSWLHPHYIALGLGASPCHVLYSPGPETGLSALSLLSPHIYYFVFRSRSQ